MAAATLPSAASRRGRTAPPSLSPPPPQSPSQALARAAMLIELEPNFRFAEPSRAGRLGSARLDCNPLKPLSLRSFPLPPPLSLSLSLYIYIFIAFAWDSLRFIVSYPRICISLSLCEFLWRYSRLQEPSLGFQSLEILSKCGVVIMDNSDPNQEYNKILRKFIHDYFVRKKLSDTAAIFAHEAEVSENKEDVIDYPPHGFLLEWWAALTSTAEGIPQTTDRPFDQINPDANQWRSLIAFASEYLRKLRDEKRALGMPSSSHAYAGPSQQQIPDDAQQQTATDTRSAQDPSVAMSTTSSKLQENLTAHNMREQDGFSFKEIHRLHSSKDGIVCCDFSSDGRFLAAAGHERKIHLWSMKGFDCITIGELHSDLITDIRFRPCSNIFATSSFDRTVKMWHANGIKQLFQFVGHTGKVTSIDFDPVNPDYFCSCDSTDEIRQWSISISSSRSVYKGASRQVRFQPLTGDLLAAASGNTINLFDVKTDKLVFSFKGHVNEVHSICWDKSGAYVASVSEDSARIWSVALNGKCIHVLNSQGNRFGTGIFHPDHPLLLVVGSYQALQLWNPTTNNGTMSVTAHNDVISALADCRETGVVASAGKDEFVKIWK